MILRAFIVIPIIAVTITITIKIKVILTHSTYAQTYQFTPFVGVYVCIYIYVDMWVRARGSGLLFEDAPREKGDFQVGEPG